MCELLEAIVHRKRGPFWIFRYDPQYDLLTYRTKDNIYAIFMEPLSVKCVWIGRLAVSDSGKQVWYTCESQIGALEIDFTFGKYVFYR